MNLYKQVDFMNGDPVCYVGVHTTKWMPEWGDPTVGFSSVDDDKELLALADAIYKDLGLGWNPYPENKPPNESKDYFVVVLSAGKTTVFYAHWSKIKNAWLSPFGGLMEEWHDKVIAYMEIPVYQPED